MRRHFLFSFMALTAAACGGKAISEQPPPSDHPTSEGPTLVAGETSGALGVFAVDPSTGKTTAFGPALPVDASALQVSQLFTSADGARAIVVLTRKPATPGSTDLPSPILAGDGTQWVTLFSGVDGASVVNAAQDLSLAVLYHECNGGGGRGPTGNIVSVVAFDGTHVFDEGSCSPAVRADTQVKVAPHGAFFVYRNAGGDTVVRDRAGVEHVAAKGPNALLPMTVFDESFVAGSPNGPAWFDASGAQLVVPGLPSAYDVDATYAVDDTGLWALDGKTARRTLSASPDAPLSISSLRGVLTDSLVTMFDEDSNGATKAHAVDASGRTVATYGPPASPSDPSRVATIANFAQFGVEGGPAWLVLDTQELPAIPQSGANPAYRRSEDLWVLRDASGNLAPHVVSLRTAPVGDPTATLSLRTYVASMSGAHALYIENAELHAIDTTTGMDTKLAVDFAVSDRSIAVSPPR